jgi:hypothetical protein
VLLSMTVALWPAVQSATVTGSKPKTITWFGHSYTPTQEAAYIILVILVSALGSYVHAATSFVDYVGNRKFRRSWVWWYLLRLFTGTSLALLFYFAIRGGFFATSASTTAVNPYGIGALAGLVGLFSKQATDKLRELFDVAFRVAPGYGDAARGDSITNPVPALVGSEPEGLKRGEVDLVVVGSGFTSTSEVRVSVAGGAAVPRKVTFLTPQRLDVSLDPNDVVDAGALVFTVVNPPPGGGESKPLYVRIDEQPSDTDTTQPAPNAP